MKYLIALVGLIGLVSCGQKYLAFEYVSANQSGGFTLTVNKDSIFYERQGYRASTDAAAIDKAMWKKLKTEASSIDLETIDTLTAPSNDRAVDRVASAYIKIYVKDTVYQSATFDGLNPNAVLKPLTDSLFRVSAILKQK